MLGLEWGRDETICVLGRPRVFNSAEKYGHDSGFAK